MERWAPPQVLPPDSRGQLAWGGGSKTNRDLSRWCLMVVYHAIFYTYPGMTLALYNIFTYIHIIILCINIPGMTHDINMYRHH